MFYIENILFFSLLKDVILLIFSTKSVKKMILLAYYINQKCLRNPNLKN